MNICFFVMESLSLDSSTLLFHCFSTLEGSYKKTKRTMIFWLFVQVWKQNCGNYSFFNPFSLEAESEVNLAGLKLIELRIKKKQSMQARILRPKLRICQNCGTSVSHRKLIRLLMAMPKHVTSGNRCMCTNISQLMKLARIIHTPQTPYIEA